MLWISAEKFEPGAVKVSRELDELMGLDADMGRFVEDCLSRHCSGDWGTVPEDRARANNEAVGMESRGMGGGAIRSLYSYPPLPAVEIVTDADRKNTAVGLARR